MSRQLFQYHPVVGYHFVPGLRARVPHEGGGYLVRVNSSGFRCDHDFVPRRNDGGFRILLFGDSYSAGDGVSNADRFGDRLERILPGVEVYNLALPGTGTDQHYLVWREFARGLDHDLVVIAILVENIRRVAARFRTFQSDDGRRLVYAKPYFEIDAAGAMVLRHVPVPRDPIDPSEIPESEQEHVDRGGALEPLRRLVNRMGPGLKDRILRLSRYQPLPAYDSPESPSWRLMRTILATWIGEVRVPVVLFPIPLYHYVEETASPAGYRARFRELAAPPRVTVLDPLADFYRVPRADRRAFRFGSDPHPTPAAHRVLAHCLARALAPLAGISEVQAV